MLQIRVLLIIISLESFMRAVQSCHGPVSALFVALGFIGPKGLWEFSKQFSLGSDMH